MQEFDQLKLDIAELISTASDTIDQLVAEAATRAAAAVATPIPGAAQVAVVDPNAFVSQLTQLSADVKTATTRFKAQAATILGVPANTTTTTVPTPPVPATVNVDPVLPSEPAPTSASLPAVDVVPQPDPAPAPGGVTIGPNSFRSGA